MLFEKIIEFCQTKPNGTYDLIPVVDPYKREVSFKRGNSLLPTLHPDTKEIEQLCEKTFTDVHPNRIAELVKLERVFLKKDRADGE